MSNTAPPRSGSPVHSGAATTDLASADRRLERSADERVLAGVCDGIAAGARIDVALVRLAFLVAVAVGGIGIVIYIAAAAGMPLAEGRSPAPLRARLPMALGTTLIVACLVAAAGTAGLILPDGILAPITLAAAGTALIWRRTGGEVRVGAARMRLPGGARALAGVSLVAGGVALAFIQSGGIGPVVAAALSAGTVAAGIGLLAAPALRKARAETELQRRERITSEERARVATRLHDSVLQTLALIQREPDAERVRSLARRQDRELRAWLHGGEDLDASATLGGALRSAVADVEEAYRIDVALVQPTDIPLDGPLEALVLAAREAMTNAAKHAGVERINVLVRIWAHQVSVFIGDRGVGFDQGGVPADRRGLSDSIHARMTQVGGRAMVESAPGAGTDIELVVPRDSAP